MIFVGGSGESSISLRTYSTSTSYSITPIGSGQSGDICVLLSYGHYSGGTPTSVPSPPSGWSQGCNTYFNGHGMNSFFKVLNGSETSAVTLLNSSGYLAGGIVALFFSGGPSSPSANSIQASITYSTSSLSATVTSGSGGTPLIVCGIMNSNSSSAPPSFSPTENANYSLYSPQPVTKVYYKIYNSSPSDITLLVPGITDTTFTKSVGGFYLT